MKMMKGLFWPKKELNYSGLFFFALSENFSLMWGQNEEEKSETFMENGDLGFFLLSKHEN